MACGPLSYGQDEDEIDRMVTKRMQRQQVLCQPAKRVQVVMLAGALRPRVVSVPVFPLSGFRPYDDLVIVESIVGEQQLAEADDVARYEKYLELL